MANNESWGRPQPTDGSVYPFNNVTQTRGGHTFEVDDTLGHERLLRQHKSGTSEEINPTGDRTITVYGSGYKVVHGEDNIVVEGNVNITVLGNCNTVVNGNYNIEVNGDYNETVKGKRRTKVGAQYLMEVADEYAVNCGASGKMTFHNNYELRMSANYILHIGGTSTTTVISTNTCTHHGDTRVIVFASSMHVCTGKNKISATQMEISSSGTTSIDAKGITVTSTASAAYKSTAATIIDAKGITAVSSAQSTYKSAGSTTIDAGNVNVKARGNAIIKGSSIRLN